MSHDSYTLAPLTPLRNSSININSCLHFMVVRFRNVIRQLVPLGFLVSREGEKGRKGRQKERGRTEEDRMEEEVEGKREETEEKNRGRRKGEAVRSCQ